VLQEIDRLELWRHAAEQGAYIQAQVGGWSHPLIREVRGKGLMLGFVLEAPQLEKCSAFVESAQTPALFMVNLLMQAGLLTVPAGAEVLRWLPSLLVTREEVDLGLAKMKGVLDQLCRQDI